MVCAAFEGKTSRKRHSECSNQMSIMIKKTIWILVAVTVLAFVLTTTVGAAERNRQSAQLANASTAVVPAIPADVTSLSLADLPTAPIAVVTPDDGDAAIAAVLQSRALPNVAARVSAMRTAGLFHPVQKAATTHGRRPERRP
jgi:hypothetical protein